MTRRPTDPRRRRPAALGLGLGIGLAIGLGIGFGLDPGLGRAEEPLDGGTSIKVEVADGGETTVEVKRGLLAVRAGGKTVKVAAGEAFHVKKGEAGKKLLRAPSGLEPAHGTTLAKLDFNVKFDPVPGASAYQVLVAVDPDFTKIVWRADRAEGGRVSARVQEAGTYWWRVAAVDQGANVVGRASPARKIVIDTTPPRLKAGRLKWR